MNKDIIMIYPVLIKQVDNVFLVYIPDLNLYTEGESFADAIYMARDSIGTAGLDYSLVEDMPKASDTRNVLKKAKQSATPELDFSDGILTFVDINFTAYQNRIRNKAVKKNCTIPYWLNEKAEAMNINFSKVLQDALLSIVNA